jgi:hypothetical protein
MSTENKCPPRQAQPIGAAPAGRARVAASCVKRLLASAWPDDTRLTSRPWSCAPHASSVVPVAALLADGAVAPVSGPAAQAHRFAARTDGDRVIRAPRPGACRVGGGAAAHPAPRAAHATVGLGRAAGHGGAARRARTRGGRGGGSAFGRGLSSAPPFLVPIRNGVGFRNCPLRPLNPDQWTTSDGGERQVGRHSLEVAGGWRT